jgi:hypothetical protein
MTLSSRSDTDLKQIVMRRGTAIGVSAVVALAGLGAAAPAGLAPARAKAATEYDSLVAYWPAGKLKVGKRISYRFACASDCQVTARSTLVLPGPNLGPVVDTAIFSAGQIGRETLTLNKAARFMIASHLGASKLRTSIAASTSTGQTDSDARVFRFKR